MIKLKQITLSNFMSYGRAPTIIQLDEQKKTMVYGENLDVGSEGESANGAGKTTWIQAVIFAIYGQGIDKIKPDEFVNLKNEKKLLVELDFEIDGIPYQIRRGRKPAFVELRSGETSLTRDSMKNTDDDIVKLLGIPYELFIRSVFMNPHTEPFMAMTSANQRNFMEELLSLNTLSERADVLKKVVRKDTQDRLTMKKYEYDAASKANETIQSTIDSLLKKEMEFISENKRKHDELLIELERIGTEEPNPKHSIEVLNEKRNEHLAKVNSISERIQLLVNQQGDWGQKLKMLKETYVLRQQFDERHYEKNASIKAKLDALPPREIVVSYFDTWEKFDKIVDSNLSYLKEKESLEDSIKTKNKELNKLVNEIEILSSGKCPYCSQEHFDENKIDKLITEAEKLNKSIDDDSLTVEDITPKIEKNKEDSSVLREILDRVESQYPDIEGFSDVKKFDLYALELKKSLTDIHIDNPYDITICDLELEIGSIDSATQTIEKLISDVEALNNEKDSYIVMIEQIDQELKEHQLLAEYQTRKKQIEFDISEIEIAINPYSGLIVEQRAGMVNTNVIEEDIREIDKELTHINYLIKLLTDPKSFVRKNIIETCVPYINQRIVKRSQELGLTHVCTINSDMSVDIEYMGKSVSYFLMSRGERLRLNTATSLAFRDMMFTLGKGINVLFVDELLDGSSDSSGMYAIFDMISKVTDDLFVISHRDEFKDRVDRNMKITKQNGFSDISWF